MAADSRHIEKTTKFLNKIGAFIRPDHKNNVLSLPALAVSYSFLPSEAKKELETLFGKLVKNPSLGLSELKPSAYPILSECPAIEDFIEDVVNVLSTSHDNPEITDLITTLTKS